MRQVTVTGTVGAPVETVFDFVLDTRNDTRWCPLVSDVELVDGDPGVGAVYRFRQRLGRRSSTMSTRTTVAQRPRLLSWENADRGAEYSSTIEFEPAGDRTAVRHTNQVDMPSPVAQLVWFLGAQVILRRQLRNLDREVSR